MATRVTKSTKVASQAAKTLGRLGGLKGGPARAATLSHNQRSKIARQGGLSSHRSGKKKEK